MDSLFKISVIRIISGMVLPSNFRAILGNFGTSGNFPDPRCSAQIRGLGFAFPITGSPDHVRSPDLFLIRVIRGKVCFCWRGC